MPFQFSHLEPHPPHESNNRGTHLCVSISRQAHEYDVMEKTICTMFINQRMSSCRSTAVSIYTVRVPTGQRAESFETTLHYSSIYLLIATIHSDSSKQCLPQQPQQPQPRQQHYLVLTQHHKISKYPEDQ